MTYVVVVADRVADPGLEILLKQPELEIVSVVGDAKRLDQELARAHALLVRSDTQVTEERIARAPHLMVIGRAGTGVDNIDVDAATRRGIAVLNAAGANTVSAAEHAVALLLALVRRIPWAAASMRDGAWDRKRFAGSELCDKQLGVVGLGRVGLRVATIARALGMTILAHDPYLPEERAADLGIELVDLETLLATSDMVTLHVPLTDDTRHLIDRERLRLMKRGSYVVNTARGGLVDDGALLEALESGHLAGAALDVFDPEPLPGDSPMRRASGLLLTPHLAASTSEAQERVATEICRYVRDALLSGALRGAINLPGVPGDALQRLSGVLDLARGLGRLAAGIAGGAVRSIDVVYGGRHEAAPRPVMLAAVEGVLSAAGITPVTLVNAAERARQRGIATSRSVGAPLAGFETTVGVSVATAERVTTVDGAMLGEVAARVIRIDGFDVDVPAHGTMLVLRNRDVPGVIGRVGTVLGTAGINVGSYHQSRRDQAGSEALAAIVVDEEPNGNVLSTLAGLPDLLEVKVARLG
ncbi:MAG: phosphoglycerate dehydrogenase [Gemmatimonadota bacterium]|nr:phosphoglycerate dehydrogenase [Gemmatimonadota bacterium]MDH3366940.1 phosphoglycerate dehydrogenase [Gemmatimonadota bacterium]MDH3477539.1 phosphoglycerate dehydrogenase [Gemmatimonadota bacterium]MDH3569856.1 phosphoglycerate dehydrogenase [Gemmatimonadota bacterium]MDH5550688.1 phosphoglycerate dehydrogenase [Gemmatimonadota bacterium]